MGDVSPVYLLLAAIVCSIAARLKLVRAAWEIGKGWGIAVACIPLAPWIFLMKHQELRSEGLALRRLAGVCFLIFGALTASQGTDSLNQLWTLVPEKLRPAEYRFAGSVELIPDRAEGEEEMAPEAAAESETHPPVTTLKSKATPEEKKNFFTRIAALVQSSSPGAAKSPAAIATTAPAATTAAAAPAEPALPAGPSLSERVTANQAEFARLAEVYEGLKKERGYLKKWDQDQIKGYNELAAKYQTELAKARAEQVELNKQIALVKK